jgi:hypothetical protein
MPDPTTIGIIITIIGVIAFVCGSLKFANLELSPKTVKGRLTLIFSLLHVLVGVAIIFYH